MATVHRLSSDEYYQMAERFGWARTELRRGVVYDMAPEYDLHANLCEDVRALLRDRFSANDVASATLHLFAGSDPEPDAVLLRRSRAQPGVLRRHAPLQGADALLVVEVSVTTEAVDLGEKLEDYAAAGIPRYFVLIPERGELHCLADPEGGRYRKHDTINVSAGERRLDMDRIGDAISATRQT